MSELPTQLYDAIWARKDPTEALRILAEEEIDVGIGPFGKPTRTFLHYACQFGLNDVARRLLEMGSDVNLRDGDRAPLHYALKSDHHNVELIEMLLDAGARIDDEGPDKKRPVELAATYSRYTPNEERVKILKLLLARGASVTGAIGQGALESAIGSPETLASLFAAGVHPERASVLRKAAAEGDVSSFHLLWDKGLRIEEQPGEDLFLVAACSGGPELVRFCVQQGALVDARHAAERAPLQSAALNGMREVVQILLEAGAKIDHADHERTALGDAVNYGYADVVTLLLEHGADPTLPQYAGGLLNAIAKKHTEISIALIAAGAPFGADELCTAVELGLAPVVQQLIAKGVSLDAPSASGRRALEIAVEKPRPEIVRLLLLARADRTLAVNGKTLQQLGDGSPSEIVRQLFAASEVELSQIEIAKPSLAFVSARALLADGEASWPDHVRRQLEKIFGTADRAGLEEANDGGEISLIDVVDGQTKTVRFQLYLYPYGDGTVFHHQTTDTLAAIVQHGFEVTEDMDREDARAWIEQFEDAYRTAAAPLAYALTFD